jgi:nucleoside-diphosphate-sugar epimerase
MDTTNLICKSDDLLLVTGGTGFLGPAVIRALLRHGFRNIRAFARHSSNISGLEAIAQEHAGTARLEIVRGNLLSPESCADVVRGAAIIFHLAIGGDKSFPGAVLNSVVTTRNLLDASVKDGSLRRFVNISSFAVYSNCDKARFRMLDESSPVESKPEVRGDSYTFSKAKQDDIVIEYGDKFGVPYVILRPGTIYGPGKQGLTGRVGIDTFGFYMHMGGSNTIPLTYIDNCADAIVMAGVIPGVDGEVFNIVDDDLPSSRKLLRLYKRNVKHFRSIYMPRAAAYTLCWMWEKYSSWSMGQLPPAFNRSRWHAEWKKTRYSNQKLKSKLGWKPQVSTSQGLEKFFEYCRESAPHA